MADALSLMVSIYRRILYSQRFGGIMKCIGAYCGMPLLRNVLVYFGKSIGVVNNADRSCQNF